MKIDKIDFYLDFWIRVEKIWTFFIFTPKEFDRSINILTIVKKSTKKSVFFVVYGF